MACLFQVLVDKDSRCCMLVLSCPVQLLVEALDKHRLLEASLPMRIRSATRRAIASSPSSSFWALSYKISK